jgi:hypothetical protein
LYRFVCNIKQINYRDLPDGYQPTEPEFLPPAGKAALLAQIRREAARA